MTVNHIETLTIDLLGPPLVTVDGEPVEHFRSAKALGLLAYLAIEASAPQPRDTLATLLWPDSSTTYARKNLAQTHRRLRHALQDDDDPSLFESNRHTLRLRRDARIRCDLWQVERLLERCTAHDHPAEATCVACEARLREAVALARGELLAGFTVPDSTLFEEWLLLAREAWFEQRMELLHRVTQAALAGGRYEEARRYVRQQVALEPWRESAHQQLMQALALDGQRSAALAHFQQCTRILDEELGVAPSPATLDLFERIRDGHLALEEPVDEPPPTPDPVTPAPPPRSSPLPHRLTRFFGRERELQQVAEQLCVADNRLLTIVGPGGIGKTRFALEVAHRQQAHFEDGVYFVPLAGVKRADDIPAAIAQALHLALGEREAPAEQLLRYVAGRRMLLLLDNMEHLLAGATWLLTLLEHASGLTLLVTSRERLNMQAEDLFSLHGLDTPPPDATVAEAATVASVRLFLDRARRLDKGFRLTPGNVGAVARICRLVEGLPLGLELATTWVRDLSPVEIADSIGESLDILESTHRDRPARHRSLRAAFAYSWQLLSADEQRVLARLAAFRGGFTSAAAQAVAVARPLDIIRLRFKSLVRRGEWQRLEMHELVRQFAEEQLRRHPDDAHATAQRHSRWNLARLTEALDALQGEAYHEVAADLQRDLDNLRAAWEFAVTDDALPTDGAAVRALGRFFRIEGYYQEGITRLAAAATVLRERLSARSSPDPERQQLLGWLLLEQSRCALAQRTADETVLAELRTARHLATAAGAAALHCKARLHEAEGLRLLGRLDEARARLDELLPELRRRGLVALEGAALREMGKVCSHRHEITDSTRYFTEALTIQRRLRNLLEEIELLLNLGFNAILELDYIRAHRHLQEASDCFDPHTSRYTEIRILSGFGMADAALGDYEGAMRYHEKALSISRRYGYRSMEVFHLYDICHVRTMERDLDAATALGEAAVALALELGAPDAEHYARLHLGFAYLAAERWAPAQAEFERARQGWLSLHNHPLTMEATAGLARAVQAQAQSAGEAECARADALAVSAFLREGNVIGTDVPFRIFCLCHHVLQAHAHHDEARRVLAVGHAILQSTAARIPDPDARATFLHNVPPNRALWQAVQRELT